MLIVSIIMALIGVFLCYITYLSIKEKENRYPGATFGVFIIGVALIVGSLISIIRMY
jgi:hypothetical protein